jgi:hypothetical protein
MAEDKAKKALFVTLWTTDFGKVDPLSCSVIIGEHRDIPGVV